MTSIYSPAPRNRIRSATHQQWIDVNPVLGDGELGYDKDLSVLKVGDGSSRWLSLPVTQGETGLTGPGGVTANNVKEFGAVGDGVADDTSEIQAAFAEAGLNGLPVWFPPGTYLVTQLTINTGLSIFGVPGKSVIKAHSSKARTAAMVKTAGNGPTRIVKNLRITGLIFDGALLPPMRWLQTPDGLTTITNPQADYYHAVNNPTGKIGNPSFPDYDIFDAVAEGRRNPNYTQQSPLLDLVVCENAVIEGNTFRNHYGVGIQERGGLNVTIRGNHFDTIGKNDGPFPAIWTQSQGTPGNGDPWYQDSENIQILGNTARNLERLFAIFSPTKGGKCNGNVVEGWGEAAIFTLASINQFGGTSEIVGNVLRNGTLTDISGAGIECNKSTDLTIRDNLIEGSTHMAISIPGCKRVTIEGNRFYNCQKEFTYPYGPFSERFGYAVGAAPIAGQSHPITSGEYIRLGILEGVGGEDVIIRGNVFRETRAAFPPLFRQLKSGGSSLTGDHLIADNVLDVPALMPFFDNSVTGVWQSNMPLHIRGNVGHVSESPVAITKQWSTGETGLYTVNVGFRPRHVRVMASANNNQSGKASISEFSWTRSGARNDTALHITTVSGTGQSLFIPGTPSNAIVRIASTTGANETVIGFFAWTETGFTVNATSVAALTNVTFFCSP